MCKHDPCKVIQYKDAIEGELSTLSDSLDNSKKRNHLYRCFVFGEYGALGRHNWIRIPDCVVAFIRSVCPNPQNLYTGHRDVDEEGSEVDNMDDVDRPSESFEPILPDAIQGSIDFDGGEKIKVSVSFENDVFDIAKVREFIAKLPVQGWHVS
jgi:hypothetical protein